MGERKVVNKYLPPDFDPSLVPRTKKPKDGLVSVRMMLPFSIQCSNCAVFMYQGRKFNSKKELMTGANGKYLGTIQRFRFYIKCTSCAQPISFLTDPQNADYEMETGATRNYELRRDQKDTEEQDMVQEHQQEQEDPLKGLENRVLASQREMADMDNLEEIRAMNQRHVQFLQGSTSTYQNNQDNNNTSASTTSTGTGNSFLDATKRVLEATARHKRQLEQLQEEEILNEEDEQLIQSIQFGKTTTTTKNNTTTTTNMKDMDKTIHRLNDDDERALERKRKQQLFMLEQQQQQHKQQDESVSKTKQNGTTPKMPIITIKRRRVTAPSTAPPIPKEEIKEEPPPGLGNLLGGYGSSDSSSTS